MPYCKYDSTEVKHKYPTEIKNTTENINMKK